jgi:hypothetical protein
MAAIISMNERNGISPGTVTQNIPQISWKMVDDSTTPYSSYSSAISLGLNSYTKYVYLVFTGQFTTISNVAITYVSGNLLPGVQLMSSPSLSLDSPLPSYATPTSADIGLTNNISAIGSSVNLLVGPIGSSSDPATAPNKLVTCNNDPVTGMLVSSYFITQLLTTKYSSTGVIDSINFQVSFNST